MSLLKLLTTGRSLVGMEDTSCRYRMNRRNLLPKFGSAKNPFAVPTKSNPAPAASDSSLATAPMETRPLFGTESNGPATPKEARKTMPRPAKTIKVPIPQPQAEPATAPVAATASPATTVSVGPTPTISIRPDSGRSWTRWFSFFAKLNPLTWFGGRAGSSAFSGRGRVGRRPVQAELTLDRVQVVRNDLRDADLEIVPGKLMGMPSGASPVLSKAARPDFSPWGRMASRLMDFEHIPL